MNAIIGAFGTMLSYLRVFVGWILLALICLAWSIIALPAYLLLPVRSGTALGRAGIRAGFRLFVHVLQFMNIYRFDLRELEGLRDDAQPSATD